VYYKTLTMYIIVIVFSYNTITKLKNIIVIVQVDTSKKI